MLLTVRGVALRSLLGVGALCGLLAGTARAPERQAFRSLPAGTSSPAPLRSGSGFGKFPLQFIPNEGRTDRAVAYYVEGRDKTVYFTAEGLTFVFTDSGRDPGSVSSAPRWVVKLDFVDARKGARPVGLEKSGAIVSYFNGRPGAWKTGLAACSKLVYRDLWPGIDLVYSGTFDRLKYEFAVRPGADPSRIALACRGAETVELTADGRLAIRTPAGGFEDDAPFAYQEIDGARRVVPVAYDLDGDLYGFTVGRYDRAHALLIDPSSLVYCGFIGGQGAEEGSGIALDSEGSAYIAGVTTSSETSFPLSVGPDLTFNGGSEDAFIAKVAPDGTGLVYCGYIGGSAADGALKIAVDASGSAYVAGYTNSDESTFPVVTGPDLTYNGYPDAFVAKVDPAGTTLVYCGYIGGEWLDTAMGIAVDGLGNAYVSGATASDQKTFPVKAGPDLTFNGQTYDAFVAKVDATGTELAYCGYIGGFYDDISQGIAVDGLGNAYVSGTTASSETDGFPVVAGPTLKFQGGGLDAFVAKVNAAGQLLPGRPALALPGRLLGFGTVDGREHAPRRPLGPAGDRELDELPHHLSLDDLGRGLADRGLACCLHPGLEPDFEAAAVRDPGRRVGPDVPGDDPDVVLVDGVVLLGERVVRPEDVRHFRRVPAGEQVVGERQHLGEEALVLDPGVSERKVAHERVVGVGPRPAPGLRNRGSGLSPERGLPQEEVEGTHARVAEPLRPGVELAAVEAVDRPRGFEDVGITPEPLGRVPQRPRARSRLRGFREHGVRVRVPDAARDPFFELGVLPVDRGRVLREGHRGPSQSLLSSSMPMAAAIDSSRRSSRFLTLTSGIFVTRENAVRTSWTVTPFFGSSLFRVGQEPSGRM